jgi:hypothetical protein
MNGRVHDAGVATCFKHSFYLMVGGTFLNQVARVANETKRYIPQGDMSATIGG